MSKNIMDMTLQEIKDSVTKNSIKVNDASYWLYDRKLSVLNIYDELMSAIKTIDKFSRFVNDQEYVDDIINGFSNDKA